MGIFSFLYLLLSAVCVVDAGGWVGVNYGRLADNLPPPAKVVELLKSQGINRVKILNMEDTNVMTALANSGISVVLVLPNGLLQTIALPNRIFSDKFMEVIKTKHYPAVKIEAIGVGTDVFVDHRNITPYLVPAMKNIHASLQKFKLDGSIKVSSPISFSALESTFPPSIGSFQQDLVEPVMKPMLEFLRQTQSYLMVNMYPFYTYSTNSDKVPLTYALFQDNPGVVDSSNGLKYYNLFDAQVDAVYAAMSALKYDDIKLVVTEVGWPSRGDDKELGASMENAATFNGNLVRRVLTGNGTPLRSKDPVNVFLLSLFNENLIEGQTSKRNYGLFYPNEEMVYDIPLTSDQLKTSPKTSVNGSNSQVPPANGTPSSKGQTWCVAKPNAAGNKLQAALEYACGTGGADCGPIQLGSTCYNPNTVQAHASYAFNSYYQKNAHAAGTCDFNGVAYVVNQPPKYGDCEFPTVMPPPASGTPPPASGTPPSNGTPPANGTPPENGTPPDSETPSTVGQLWCVAIENADPGKLKVGMEFACGEGGADCGPIQPGAACFIPNVLVAHASYAFNNYYQKKNHAPGSCDFDGTAKVVDQLPQFGECKLSSGTGSTWHGNGTVPNTGASSPEAETWCVANGQAGVEILTAWLRFACWKGWADCSLIQPGSTCYNDGQLLAQTSYVFNGYYQKKGRAPGSCDFAGVAYITSQRPQFGECEFITKSNNAQPPSSASWFTQGRTWCVASKNVGDEILLAWMKYACDGGLADCNPITEEGPCYDNNSTITHASWVFNSYYEKKGHAPGSCDFGGAAYLVTQPPRYGDCELAPRMQPSSETTWCVAKQNVDEGKLQAGLKYACGEGQADCGPIQPGSTCYNPNTLEAHASYAFNSYYQMRNRDASACNFDGVAQTVKEAPKYGECQFPTEYTSGS